MNWPRIKSTSGTVHYCLGDSPIHPSRAHTFCDMNPLRTMWSDAGSEPVDCTNCIQMLIEAREGRKQLFSIDERIAHAIRTTELYAANSAAKASVPDANL